MDELPPRSPRAEEPHEGQDGPPAQRVPVFNLPPGILIVLVGLGVIYAVQSLLLPGAAAEWLAVTFGFSPLRYVHPLSQQGYEWFWTPVTYSLLHGSIEHLAFNGLWLAAFGTPVLRRIGNLRFVIF
ncbi:MAG: rhomboid family intramembrane serine protease, partial [Rhizobium sp.]|nr:rhomboid family intramembrane serine protease [Rhizobium sp.]